MFDRGKKIAIAVAWGTLAALSPAGNAFASDSVGIASRDYGIVPARHITFPVPSANASDFTDDFASDRGAWSHKGQDIYQPKLAKIVAATDGTITNLLVSVASTGPGNLLEITAPDGWKTEYMHINNDSPGTDDDSNSPEYRFAPGIAKGSVVKGGDFIAYVGDSGDAESTTSHLHFEIRTPKNISINPHPSLRLALGLPVGSRCDFDKSVSRSSTPNSAGGYYQLGSYGAMFGFGSNTTKKLNDPAGTTGVVAMAAGVQPGAYWEVTAPGAVQAYGGAPQLGSIAAIGSTAHVVQMVSTNSGKGYWIASSDGSVYNFGDAVAFATSPAVQSPTIGIAPTPTDRGLWIAHRDGTVTHLGDAGDFGGQINSHAPANSAAPLEPIASIASTATGKGYVLAGVGGSVYPLGDAQFFGALNPAVSGLCQARTVIRIAYSASGSGYWIATSEGAVWGYGDAISYGDLASDPEAQRLAVPIVDFVTTAANGFQPVAVVETVSNCFATCAKTGSAAATTSRGVSRTYVAVCAFVLAGIAVTLHARRRRLPAKT